MYLRFTHRQSQEFIMFNMNKVIWVEKGNAKPGELPWCMLVHEPVVVDQNGEETLTVTEVSTDFDEMSMLLSGRWERDPL